MDRRCFCARQTTTNAVNHILALAKKHEKTLSAYGTHDGSVATYVASQNGFLDIVTALIDGMKEVVGAVDIDCPTRAANLTPLMLAATHGHANVVKYLLDKKANPWTLAADSRSCLDMVKMARVKAGKQNKNDAHDVYQVETAEKSEDLKASLQHVERLLFEITGGEVLDVPDIRIR